jgi:hypothetical protein
MVGSVVEETVRVCEDCKKPVRALDRDEYTQQRAVLIVERGLCMCASEADEPPEETKPAKTPATRQRGTTRRRRTAGTSRS